MAKVLGVNAVFHDPAAAVVVDGQIVAAPGEERFSRRKHHKPTVPFSTWEVPERSARWCLEAAGIGATELDAVTYSYEPAILSSAAVPSASGVRPRPAPPVPVDVTAQAWEPLRTLFASEAPGFLRTALPGLDPEQVRFVPHHIGHAASAYLAAPFPNGDVVLGRVMAPVVTLERAPEIFDGPIPSPYMLRGALECFGSSPIDVLALGPFVVRRSALAARRPTTAAWSVAATR